LRLDDRFWLLRHPLQCMIHSLINSKRQRQRQGHAQGDPGYNKATKYPPCMTSASLILFPLLLVLAAISWYIGIYNPLSLINSRRSFVIFFHIQPINHSSVENIQPTQTSYPRSIPSCKPTILPKEWENLRKALVPSSKPTHSPSRQIFKTTSQQCSLNEKNHSCHLNILNYHENLQIFPSSSSASSPPCGCIESHEKYSFGVTKGDSDSLLLFFQGGGLCWNQESLKSHRCRTYAMSPAELGVLDRMNPKNPYQNFTTISIPYCTGDYFLGNGTDYYSDSSGDTVSYKGQQNVLMILHWLRNEQHYGNYLTRNRFKNLILVGSSAGSIGVTIWSSYISTLFPSQSTSVLADSLLIPSPHQYDMILYTKWNFCSSFLLPLSLFSLCQSQQLHHLDLLKEIIHTNPHIRYFIISSKRDWTALALYNSLLTSFTPTTSPTLSPVRSHSYPRWSPPSPNPTPSSKSSEPVLRPTRSPRRNAHPFPIRSRALKSHTPVPTPTPPPQHEFLSEDEYYQLMKDTLLHLIQTNRHSQNLFFYLIESFTHIYLNRETMYTATASSEHGLLITVTNDPSAQSPPLPVPGTPPVHHRFSSRIALYEWLGAIVNHSYPDAVTTHSLSSVCEGEDCDILFQGQP
jgi:hypothetical protein